MVGQPTGATAPTGPLDVVAFFTTDDYAGSANAQFAAVIVRLDVRATPPAALVTLPLLTRTRARSRRPTRRSGCMATDR